MRAAPAPLNGSTAWASRYAVELRRVVTEHAARAPRSTQTYLGPSELGAACDRQVAGKMAGLPATNHISDPWPSIVGTAIHAWLAEAFEGDNARSGVLRWIAEQRVTPHPNHPGTADLYDAVNHAVVDHKCLGRTTLAKLRTHGPSRKYLVQLLLYGEGYRRLGLPVDRVVLAAYPRTEATLDGLYVWERAHTPEDDEILQAVFAQTDIRYAYATELREERIQLRDIPARPSDEECYYCPFYRPESRDGHHAGCPGTVGNRQER